LSAISRRRRLLHRARVAKRYDDIWPLERPFRKRYAYEMLFGCLEKPRIVG
jgi:hypothetical protein